MTREHGIPNRRESDDANVHLSEPLMKTATYTLLDGTKHEVEYDANAPCWMCGEPVGEASMGGTVVCPSCDCGYNRDGTKWTLAECFAAHERFNAERERRHHAV